MRNHKFRLADMMPNAWFYKLRDMNKTRNHQIPFHTIKKNQQLPAYNKYPTHHHHQIPPKYTPESESVTVLDDSTLYNSTKMHSDHDSPMSKKKPKRKTIYRPSPKQVIPASVSDQNEYFNCILEPEMDVVEADQASCFHQDTTFLEFDSPDRYSSIYDHHSFDDYSIICIKEESTSRKIEKAAAEFDDIMIISEPTTTLPRILTKPTTKHATTTPPAASDPTENYFSNIQPKKTKTTRKSVSRSRRLKIKNKKMAETCGTRNKMSTFSKDELKKASCCNCFYSESFAMVKSSFDPEKDFRDSMKEMIVEKNIKGSKELEELLACYLSLNSTQYHHLIIKAFEQIWFTMPISISS